VTAARATPIQAIPKRIQGDPPQGQKVEQITPEERQMGQPYMAQRGVAAGTNPWAMDSAANSG
jgi:hypothetical protein